MKDQEIMDLKHSIAALDANIDEIQTELDNKTQELSLTKQSLEKQQIEFSNMQHQVTVVSGKEDDF